MGTVYRARQRSLDREVALKVLHSEMAFSARARRRFGREARAVARLNHPHIASIYDFGDDDGRTLWLAMELVEGDHLGMLQTQSVDAMQLLSLTDQVLSALSAAHAREIIHRDLQPTNILVTRDERDRDVIKLVDFGLAAAENDDLDLEDAPGGIGNEISEQSDRLFGTPRYMAPELLLHDQIDPRLDLYALGVILYEIATGAPPFGGDEPADVIRAHVEEPIPPIEARDDISLPEGFEEIVSRLLAKDPTERYQSAADVRSDVRDLLNNLSHHPWLVLGPTFGGAEPNALEAVGEDDSFAEYGAQTRPPSAIQKVLEEQSAVASGGRVAPLVGRERERRQLQSHISRVVRDREGGMIFVTGEAGLGKSRLVDWIQVRVEEAGLMTIAEGAFMRSGGGLRGLLMALEDVLGVLDLERDRIREVLERRFDGAGLSSEEMSMLVDVLRPNHLSDERVLRSENQQREQLFSALEHVLRSLTDDKPLLLVLEDLHEAGGAMGAFIEHLAVGMKLDPMPLLVVGTARVGSSDGTIEFDEVMTETVRLDPDRVDHVTLGSLSTRETIQLLEKLAPLASDVASEIASRSSGHPLYALQLLEYLQESELLVYRDGTWELRETIELDDEIPEGTSELVRHRIERVGAMHGSPEDVERVLECAAILGEHFEYDVLIAMLERESRDVDIDTCDDVLELLTREGILREVGQASRDAFAFDHELMRDILLEAIEDADDRRRLHHSAADAKLEIRSEQLDDYALEIVEHLRSARDWTGVYHYTVRAAERAATNTNLERAIELYREAVQLAEQRTEIEDDDTQPSRDDARLRIGDLERKLRRYEDARDSYRALLGGDDPVRVGWSRWGLGKIAESRGALGESESWYEAGSRSARRARNRERTEEGDILEVFCLYGLGTIARLRGRYQTASTLLARVTDRADDLEQLDLQINALRALSEVNWYMGDTERAREYRRGASTLADASGDRHLQGENHLHAARLHCEAGRIDEAREEAHESIELFEEQSDRHEKARGLLVLGEIAWRDGEYQEAVESLQQAMKLYRAVQDQRGITHCKYQLARLALNYGKTDKVEQFGREAMEEYREMDDERGVIQCGLLFARLARQLGRLEEAASALEQAVEGFESLGDARGQICALSLRALVYEDMGRRGEVDRQLDELLDDPLLEEMAEEPVANAFEQLADKIENRAPDRAERLRSIADRMQQRSHRPGSRSRETTPAHNDQLQNPSTGLK
jgi:predicted ATPase